MKKKVVGLICDIGVIFIGGIIYAIAINTFSAPNKIVVSGVTGIGSIMNYLFNIPIGLFVVAVNVLLFLLSFPIRRQAYRAAHSSPISHRNHTSRLFQEVTFFEQTGFLYLHEV